MAKKGSGRGRRGAVPRVGGRFAKTTPVTVTPPTPPAATVESAAVEVDKKIGILEALLEKQKELTGGETELSTAVLGKGGTKGVRAQIEDLVRENRERLQDLDDPNNAANFAVIESALALSERAVRSKDRKEQVDIYNKLKFIRQVAEKTTGEKSDITQKVSEIIKPVETVLQRKTGFAAFAKERFAEKVKAVPEAVVRQIPLVGGLIGDYLQEKRAGREELEAYAGRRIESISQAGSKTNELERILTGRGGGGGGLPPFRGASTVGGMFGGAAGAGLAGIAAGDKGTLGQIAADVRAIKDRIVTKRSGTEGLKEKESALKAVASAAKSDEKQKGLFGGLGKTLSGLLGGGGLLGMLGGMFGMGGGGGADGQPGIMSSVTDWATDKATDWGLKKAWQGTKNVASKAWQGTKGLASKAWQGTKGLASKAWQGTKSMLGFGANAGESAAKGAVSAAESAAGGAAKGAVSAAESAAGGAAKGAVSAAETVAENKSWWKSAWEGTKNMASKGWEGAKSAGSATWEAGKAVASEAAAVAEAVAHPTTFLKGNMGKILGGMKSLGPITAALEGLIGAFNIYSIKNDPNLGPEEKKEAIGAEIAKRFGSAIGGIIGGGLGTAIGPVGTVLGGLAGALGGEWVGNQIADLVGPKGIYDFVASIPAVGDLIKVDGGTPSATPEGSTATGSISPTPTSATPAGQQANAMEMNRRGVEEVRDYAAKQSQAQAAFVSQQRTAAANMYNQNNTVVNNYNDDLRVRNSESTLKNMERSTL